MRKIKICFLIAGFSAGGAQKQCIHLLNELQNDLELDIHLIYFYEGINFYLLNHDNVTLHLIKSNSFYNLRNLKTLAILIKEIKPNIIFSWLHASDVYSGLLKIIFKDVKWIMSERDSFYPKDPRYLIRNIIGKKANMIIANSNKGKEYWINKGVKENKIKVIGNIVSIPTPYKSVSIEGDPIIVYAGRFEIQKNVLVVVKAFCELAKLYQNGKFFIIGDGTLENQIKKIVNDNNLQKQVLVLPFKKNIQDYFVSANVFVNISYHEGTPNTVIENIHLGIPVIVSNIKEHIEILGIQYPYILSEFKDPIKLIDLVNKVLLDKDNASKYLSFGKSVISYMTPEIISSKYKNAFEELIS